MKILNPEYERIPIQPLDISLRDEIGLSLDPDQLDRLTEIVETLFREKDSYRERITVILARNIFDLGDGARGGGNYIIQRLKEKLEEKEGQKVSPGQDAPREDGRSSTLVKLALRLDQLRDHGQLDHPGLTEMLNQPLPREEAKLLTGEDYLLWLMEELDSPAGNKGGGQR